MDRLPGVFVSSRLPTKPSIHFDLIIGLPAEYVSGSASTVESQGDVMVVSNSTIHPINVSSLGFSDFKDTIPLENRPNNGGSEAYQFSFIEYGELYIWRALHDVSFTIFLKVALAGLSHPAYSMISTNCTDTGYLIGNSGMPWPVSLILEQFPIFWRFQPQMAWRNHQCTVTNGPDQASLLRDVWLCSYPEHGLHGLPVCDG